MTSYTFSDFQPTLGKPVVSARMWIRPCGGLANRSSLGWLSKNGRFVHRMCSVAYSSCTQTKKQTNVGVSFKYFTMEPVSKWLLFRLLPYLPVYNAHFFSKIYSSKFALRIICGTFCLLITPLHSFAWIHERTINLVLIGCD